MSPSTLSPELTAATAPNVPADESEVDDMPSSRPSLVLSVEAKERLKLLNRVLANCVPQSLKARPVEPSETQWE